MVAAKVALRPENEAPRKTWQGPRGTTNYFIDNDVADSTSLLRIQRLSALHGIVGARAELIASLHWGAIPSYNEGMR